jgi:hypothetical protein
MFIKSKLSKKKKTKVGSLFLGGNIYLIKLALFSCPMYLQILVDIVLSICLSYMINEKFDILICLTQIDKFHSIS